MELLCSIFWNLSVLSCNIAFNQSGNEIFCLVYQRKRFSHCHHSIKCSERGYPFWTTSLLLGQKSEINERKMCFSLSYSLIHAFFFSLLSLAPSLRLFLSFTHTSPNNALLSFCNDRCDHLNVKRNFKVKCAISSPLTMIWSISLFAPVANLDNLSFEASEPEN